MELQTIISEKEGTSVSLSCVLRTACKLLLFQNKKIIDVNFIKNALNIHFKGAKKRKAIFEGNSFENKFFLSCNSEDLSETFINIKENKKNIQRIIGNFGVRKISESATAYLMGIYQNIQHYELEPISYNNNMNIEDFLKCCYHIVYSNRKIRITDQHYHLTKEIFSPNEELNLEWSFEKTETALKEKIKEKCNLDLTPSFIYCLIYKFYLTILNSCI